MVKNPPANARRHKRCGFDLWVRKIPWSRKWQPILFLPRESYGQKSLVGYSLWCCKELDTAEHEAASGQEPNWEFRLRLLQKCF